MSVHITRTGRYINCDDSRHVVYDAREEEEDEPTMHSVSLEHIGDCSNEELAELQGAIDRRRGAADRRARDRKRGRDERLSDEEREQAYAEARDALADPADHRRDFRSGDAGRRAADSRGGLAHDARSRELCDIREIFPPQHPHAEGASADVGAIFRATPIA